MQGIAVGLDGFVDVAVEIATAEGHACHKGKGKILFHLSLTTLTILNTLWGS
jgi:hypothetical protein